MQVDIDDSTHDNEYMDTPQGPMKIGVVRAFLKSALEDAEEIERIFGIEVKKH